MTEFKIGDKNIPFVFQGDEVIYPNPIKDGLVLWYDFKALYNTNEGRSKAIDLSGNNKHGALTNFNYTEESGYITAGLKFDGVDDYIHFDKHLPFRTLELALEFVDFEDRQKILIRGSSDTQYIRLLPSLDFVIHTNKSSNGSYQIKTIFIDDGVVSTYKEIKHIVFLHDLNSMVIYINGKKATDREFYPEKAQNININNIFYFDRKQSLSDILKSIKVYDRELTPEEIAHNYNIEKSRWNF